MGGKSENPREEVRRKVRRWCFTVDIQGGGTEIRLPLLTVGTVGVFAMYRGTPRTQLHLYSEYSRIKFTVNKGGKERNKETKS